ncbi:MAG TPA: benzoate-CoA ligase family protein [Nannocystaceae bacterium]|nr:benzoate-CoA ligase family protein [Nannocystaceae bacterium]
MSGSSPERYNFAAFVFAENRARATKIAYVDDRRTLTYGELEEEARRFATVLAELGVHREERIVLVMLDTVELPVAFLGALFAGVVPVLVNTMLPAADVAYVIEHSLARVVVASPALASSCAAAPQLLVVSPASLEARMAAAVPAEHCASTYADDIALWLYSSGSTGRPKAVVHSHDNIRQTALRYGKPIMGVTADDTVFSAAKLFFAYGLGNGLTFPLSVGAKVVLMSGRATPDVLFRRIVDHRVTIFCAAPTTYVAMLASPDLPAREDVALRVCVSAGEALPEAVGERFEAHFGAPILDGIGSTEMLHIYLSNRRDDVCYGTSGRPVDGYEIELRDEDGVVVPDGELGELWVRGPSVALMYWRDRARTKATFVGAWMKTGDKYRKLPSGHFAYAGRSDDMLKVSGQYVAPVEVEFALQSHGSVLEAAVVGKLDADGLMRTCAYVVLRAGHDGDDALATVLKAHVKSLLAPHKYPREIIFVADLPKTATGKVQRYRLRELG